MLCQVEALLNVPREHFSFNVFGNYKFNSSWGVNIIVSQQKKVSSWKGLTPFTNMCFLMTGKFLGQEKKMSFCTNEVILVLTGPEHSSFCFLFHVMWAEVIGKIIPLWIVTAFRACCQRESYLSSETAKPVQKAQIPWVLSRGLIRTWFGWPWVAFLKHTFHVL